MSNLKLALTVVTFDSANRAANNTLRNMTPMLKASLEIQPLFATLPCFLQWTRAFFALACGTSILYFIDLNSRDVQYAVTIAWTLGVRLLCLSKFSLRCSDGVLHLQRCDGTDFRGKSDHSRAGAAFDHTGRPAD